MFNIEFYFLDFLGMLENFEVVLEKYVDISIYICTCICIYMFVHVYIYMPIHIFFALGYVVSHFQVFFSDSVCLFNDIDPEY